MKKATEAAVYPVAFLCVQLGFQRLPYADLWLEKALSVGVLVAIVPSVLGFCYVRSRFAPSAENIGRLGLLLATATVGLLAALALAFPSDVKPRTMLPLAALQASCYTLSGFFCSVRWGLKSLFMPLLLTLAALGLGLDARIPADQTTYWLVPVVILTFSLVITGCMAGALARVPQDSP